jgi:hypothetical protein
MASRRSMRVTESFRVKCKGGRFIVEFHRYMGFAKVVEHDLMYIMLSLQLSNSTTIVIDHTRQKISVTPMIVHNFLTAVDETIGDDDCENCKRMFDMLLTCVTY